MFDVWIGDGLLLLAIPTYMVFALQRIRPRLLPGDGIVLADLESLQIEYNKRYLIRFWLLRIAPALIAIYFALRIILWPSDIDAEGPGVIQIVIAVIVTLVVSMLAAIVLRTRQERSFVAANPAFADSILPVRARIVVLVPTFASFGAMIASMVVGGSEAQFPLLALALILLAFGARNRSRQITQSRHELPWDEPLGKRIAEVVDRFGYAPKKLVIIPSLVTNAGAMPDGTVVVTSALRTLASLDEVAAVVAHELSHVRDGEGKKWSRWRMIAMLPIGLLAGIGVGMGHGLSIEPFLPPLIGFGLITFSMLSAWWMGNRTRPMEYKCDADAARIGLGLEMASCLNKIARFMGQPSHWIGIDRYLLTHPSLDERTARLMAASEPPPKLREASGT